MVCSECKKKFTKDSPELNYENYKSYNFSNREKFKNHKSNSAMCPAKNPTKKLSSNYNQIQKINELTYPVYEPYNKDIDEDIYIFKQESHKKLFELYTNKYSNLWFNENIEATCNILDNLNSETQFITLVAEPGAGKTNTIHCLIYYINLKPYENSISQHSITITTGMSDNEWFEQMKKSFTLNIGDDNQYLWEPLKDEKNYCLTHRMNFNKRVEYLKHHTKFLNNHIFIIDESHIADGENMTLDEELKSLNLTLELMEKYNIKIILISATPDVNLSIMCRADNHKIVKLNTGPNYKGFNYFNDNNFIHNYEKETNIEDEIKKYNKPKYHFIRQRAQNKDIEDWNNICRKNNWDLIEDDSDHKYYLSGQNDSNEKNKEDEGQNIIKLYNSPNKPTVIKLKNKYPAGKRLRLTTHIGLIAEKPSKQMDTSVTCNSLIPRWFGYYDNNSEFNSELKFICNIDCVNEYLTFSKDFTYKGIDYTSRRIKSTNTKLIEKENTAYGNLGEGKAISSDSDIIISDPFSDVTLIRNYLLDNCNFKKNNIKVEEISVDSFTKDDGKIWPKRNVPSHTFKKPGDTIITQSDYDNNLKNKSTFINRKGKQGKGQCFMIYPVYPTLDSKNDEVKYYVHSLKM